VSVAVDDDFEVRAGQYRHELLVHCYRMLGSVHEAEDLVQETMVRAWRAWAGYDEKLASVRTWLYRIATNACLTALHGRAHRPLPSGLGAPSDDPDTALVPAFDVPWLEPFPDNRFADPLSHVVQRGSLRLALIAAMQLLPARQRAVLILRDVLEYSAAETASLLETSVAAVNSALQRARAGLAAHPSEHEVTEPDDTAARATIEKYITAFEAANVPALVSLLTDDVVMEMPPVPLWYRGIDHYRHFMHRVFEMRGTDWRLRPVTANGQAAIAAYCLRDDAYRAHSLQVYTVVDGLIRHNVAFADPRVFTVFELPPVLAP